MSNTLRDAPMNTDIMIETEDGSAIGKVIAKGNDLAIILIDGFLETSIFIDVPWSQAKSNNEKIKEQITMKWKTQAGIDLAFDEWDDVTTEYIVALLASGWTPNVSD